MYIRWQTQALATSGEVGGQGGNPRRRSQHRRCLEATTTSSERPGRLGALLRRHATTDHILEGRHYYVVRAAHKEIQLVCVRGTEQMVDLAPIQTRPELKKISKKFSKKMEKKFFFQKQFFS